MVATFTLVGSVAALLKADGGAAAVLPGSS
jgi:hypothetical protein